MKTILNYTLTLIVLINSFHILLAQQTLSTNKKALETYKKAENHLNKQEKEEAIKTLKLTIELDSTFVIAIQQLADLYRLEKLYSQALPLYQKVIKTNPNLTPLTYFGLGETLLATGHYTSALHYLNQYSQENLTDKGRRITNKFISDCKFALSQTVNNQINLVKLPKEINTTDNEYFPKLTVDNNKIIFTRKSNNLENFYESTFRNNAWSNAKKLIGNINSDLYNEGAHCISLDGKFLFFTGCNRPGGYGSCDIYVSKLENGAWQEPINLGPTINSKYWESQPSISADGKTLFFTSNRPGGQGGYDIWKSELQNDGKWGPATNLGNNINTSFDEGAAFIHADNITLYFASNGWPGFGQIDLFYSKINKEKEWSIPINLGSPINNNYIQNSIQITLDGQYAYISSQDSSNQLDIYTTITPDKIKPNPIAYIQGNILDKDANKPISANIIVTNINTGNVVFKTQSDRNDGAFLVTLPVDSNYAFHIQKKDYLFASEYYIFQKEKNYDKKTIYLKPIKIGQFTQLNNIFFEINKYDLLPESFAELKVLIDFLKNNPKINIKIAGHTDNSGSSDKNLTLSQKRASAVKDYLTSAGISSSRLNTIGHGDKAPIADNSSAEGRRLNRRTEIIIE